MVDERAFEIRDDGLLLKVYVQPGAKRTAIVGLHNQMIKIAIKEKAQEGAANEALREFLSELLRVSKSSVTLIRGGTSRQKVINVVGEPEALMEQLNRALGR